MPAATRMASWPAPLIWKKTLFCRLSWIPLSSTLRDRYIVRHSERRFARSRAGTVSTEVATGPPRGADSAASAPGGCRSGAQQVEQASRAERGAGRDEIACETVHLVRQARGAGEAVGHDVR